VGSDPTISGSSRLHSIYSNPSTLYGIQHPSELDDSVDSHSHNSTSPTASPNLTPNLTPTRGRSRTTSLQFQTPPSPRRSNSDSSVMTVTKSLSFPGSTGSGYMKTSERMGIINRAMGLANRSPSPGELITSNRVERFAVGYS
jgi:hypothetical protein